VTVRDLVRRALGETPSSVLLKNARVVNVLTGEILRAGVAIAGDRIAGLGDYEAGEVIDLGGSYVAPGFIEAHVHVESALVPPAEYARAVVPRGTTTAVSDPHEVANVLGLEGVRFMIEQARDAPLDLYVMASSCVPATDMETSGARLSPADLASLAGDPCVLGLAEVMNYPEVVAGHEETLAKIRQFAGRMIDGHAPGLRGRRLQAYVAAGIQSEHECVTAEEALEKMRVGMTVFVREGTVARNLDDLLPVITPATADRICFCTDDCQPADLLDLGHIDHMVRRAIAGGLDPMLALRVATWSAARHFRLHDRGAVAPGWLADLVVFDDLRAPRPRLVFKRGRLVAEDGVYLAPRPAKPAPNRLPPTVHVDWDRVDLRVKAEGRHLRVIGVRPGSLVTEHLTANARLAGDLAVPDPSGDLLKLVVIDRHTGSGRVGRGFVRGIGLRLGALASSIAHDHHNLVVVGADDESMLTAARRVAAMHGGMAAAEGDRVMAELALPVAGLMSEEPVERVRERVDSLIAAARSLGSPLHDPFMTMSFLGLEVIPSLKLTDKGLVDVDRFEIVPLWVS
jgi:adenine deaminase